MASRAASMCPGLSPRFLGLLRRRTTCARPLRFLPGMLNTFLDMSSEALSRVLYFPGDLFVISAEGDYRDDKIYVLETGPRYTQYRLHYYTRARPLGSCDPLAVPEGAWIGGLGLQRLVARERGGEIELCGTNNTIAPLDEAQNSLLSVALLPVPYLEDLGGAEEPPWYIDRELAPSLYRVKARLVMAGWAGEGLRSATADVEALHPSPGDSQGRPHLAFIHWHRQERRLSVVLVPLYSYVEEYSASLALGSVYLLSLARSGEATLRELRKTYKKLAKHLEEAGAPRPEGGVPGLLSQAPGQFYAPGRGEEARVGVRDACRQCVPSHRPTLAGLEVLRNSLSTGSLLVL